MINYSKFNFTRTLIMSSMVGVLVAGSTWAASQSPLNPATQLVATKDNSNLTSTSIGKGIDIETNDDHINLESDNQLNDESGMETNDDLRVPTNSISEANAKLIVSKHYSGDEIIGFETENEEGTIVYNISLKSGIDVKIDVKNGSIIKADYRINEKEKDNSETNND